MNTILELAKFNDIVFIDETHEYIMDGVKLKSVTGLIEKYTNKFDEAYWLTRKAKELGMTEEALKEVWTFKNKHALFEGNITHDYAENKFGNKVLPDRDYSDLLAPFGEEIYHNCADLDKSIPILKSHVDKFFDETFGILVPVRMEIVLGDKDYKLCGMSDALFYSHKTKMLHVFDWKTNTKLKLSNSWQRMLAPFDNLDDCNYNHYSLQLSIYRHMIEKNTNLELGDSFLVWFNEENDSYKVHKCRDLRDKAKEILIENSKNN